MRVSVSAQISSRRCQSAELRARRENLQPEHDAISARADFRNQFLEAFAIGRRGAGLPQAAMGRKLSLHIIAGPSAGFASGVPMAAYR